jgi:3-oxoacyl-[acyl-carrier-protein] synthase II
LGEGAGAVVLEERKRAENRGAEIFGEVLGTASSASVGPKLAARRGEALATALSSVLKTTELAPAVTRPHPGPWTEHSQLRRGRVPGNWQACPGIIVRTPVPVTAAKSYFGNLGAGSGMVELIAGVLALRHGRLFSALNFETPDPACPISVATSHPDPGTSFVTLVSPPKQASAAVVCTR